MQWPTWREATTHALYGRDGFYRRERASDHFRTSVHASPLFARAIEALARDCKSRIVVDIGSGSGELLRELHRRESDLELVGVDLSPRPVDLPDSVRWTPTLVDLETTRTVEPPVLSRDDVLVVANEWLDDIPVDVVEVDDTGRPRVVHVDPLSGTEHLGETPASDDLAWLDRWWPLDGAEPGTRAEVGRTRDLAWAATVRCVHQGVVVAIDYSHRRSDRPPIGTLAGYRAGRSVAPVPNGSCDITAHVALDSCASAGIEAGATATLLTTQRRALCALGIDPTLPPRPRATDDPTSYARAVSAATRAAELLDPAGLGGFGWLVQAVGRPLPDTLAKLDG